MANRKRKGMGEVGMEKHTNSETNKLKRETSCAGLAKKNQEQHVWDIEFSRKQYGRNGEGFGHKHVGSGERKNTRLGGGPRSERKKDQWGRGASA